MPRPASSPKYRSSRGILAGEDGSPRADMVRIFVFGPGAEAEQCRYATAPAGAVAAAAAKLPPG